MEEAKKNLKNSMSFQQRRSHFDYQPHRQTEGEPDGIETVQLLPEVPRERLMKLFDDGTLRSGELDHKSVLSLQSLSEPLQLKVIEHMEIERMFLTNSRSKAGFLVSACEKAKRGELDVRGFGALDPWRVTMIAECVPRPPISLVPESDWLDQQGGDKKIVLLVSKNGETVSITCNLTDGISDVLKQHSFSKLSHVMYGSLRKDRSVAYYNLKDKDCLLAQSKRRGGRKVNRQL